MKILAVSNLYPPDICGGYELGCEQAVEALRTRGHEVRVLTTVPRIPVKADPRVVRTLKLADLWDSYTDSQGVPATLRIQEGEAFQVSAFNVHGLLRVLEEFEPDVVYLWMLIGIGGLGLLGCLQHLRVPWVWHLMDEVPPRLCSTFFQVRAELAREFSRQIRGTFLVCSRQLLDAIERRGFALGDVLEVVPNWLSGPVPPVRTRFRQGGETLRIVAAAATIDRGYDKGMDLLIRAAALLKESGHEGFRLDLFGRVNDGFFADLIRSLGLTNHVRLRGAVARTELLALYADYDVFAFPGRIGEPNAFAPLEAMPSGCVPILARQGGNCEWLVHGVHGLKVPRTAEGFAAALGRIIRGEIALEPLGRRAANVVRRDFHLDAIIPTIERSLAIASRRSRVGAGAADEAYRLAILAEKLTRIFMQAPEQSKIPA